MEACHGIVLQYNQLSSHSIQRAELLDYLFGDYVTRGHDAQYRIKSLVFFSMYLRHEQLDQNISTLRRYFGWQMAQQKCVLLPWSLVY